MKSTLSQLKAGLANAAISEDAAFDGICTDSRNLMPGSLFVALRGERFDAHDFIDQVMKSGVAAVMVEHQPANQGKPAIVVPDTRIALGQAARYWRKQFAMPLIGVTGSNGKTTVKEMIASILSVAFGEDRSLATRGNLNNDIGVPLTLFRLKAAHRAAVIELGMNHPGEIAQLAAIALPTIALVNNAQREHQEFMESVEAVARENGAVIRALSGDGTAVFPADDVFTSLWHAMAAEGGARRTMTFGLSADADVYCTCQADTFALPVR